MPRNCGSHSSAASGAGLSRFRDFGEFGNFGRFGGAGGFWRHGGSGDTAGLVGSTGSALERAPRTGSQAKEFAEILLVDSGFTHVRRDVRVPGTGVDVTFTVTDAGGVEWVFELAGSFSSGRAGLRRSDVLWRSLGKAAVLHSHTPGRPFVLLTTGMPGRGSAGQVALELVKGPGRPVADVIEILDPVARDRLRGYAAGGYADGR